MGFLSPKVPPILSVKCYFSITFTQECGSNECSDDCVMNSSLDHKV